MRIAVDSRALLAALTPATKIIERRTTIPILGHVLLEAADGRLLVTADSLDQRWSAPVVIGLEPPGAITVHAGTLHDILRRSGSGGMTIEAESDRATVRIGRARYTLPTLPATDFPAIRADPWRWQFTLPAERVKALFEGAAPFVSTEETRYYLNGIDLRAVEREDGPKLRAVATDGHRLWRHESDLPEGAAGLGSLILPLTAAAEVARNAATGEIEIRASERLMSFTFPGGATLTTKLIDGTFPDVERVIPVAPPSRAIIDREALGAALGRVTAVVAERGRAVKFDFTPDGGLALSAQSPERGEATEAIEGEVGFDLTIGFNGQYMTETLAALGGERISIGLDTPGSAAVLTAVGQPNPLCVIMPVRV